MYELRHAPSRYSAIVPVKEALQIQHPVDKEVTLTDTYNRLARIEHQKRIGTAVTPLPEGTVIEAFTKPPTKQLKQQGKRRLFSFGS